MSGLLSWQEAYEAGPAVCGGKGYNLARLARYGFRVPHGGVLAAGAHFDEIRPGLDRLGLLDAEVAVRSSAIAEDSARASFAGVYRTFLNVRGVDAVEVAVQGCLDSLMTPQAVAYRNRMGFREDDVECAVVICEMVKARSAGVAFSCDPATGRRDLIVIDGAEGLGEAVVSGRVNPQQMTWRSLSGVYRKEGLAASSPLLPAAVEGELVHAVARVHWALGEGQDPQDIEWAYDGEHLWLLQARPVTRVPRVGWSETITVPRYWSTGNIKDAVPGVVCELSWSLLNTIVEGIAYGVLNAIEYSTPPGLEVVRRFHGRGYFDFSVMQWAFYDALAMMPADIVKVVGGHHPEIPVPPNPRKGPAGRRRSRAALRLLRKIWNYPAVAQPLIDAHLAFQRDLESVDWRAMTRDELARRLVDVFDRQNAFAPVAGLANSSSGPWHLALEAMVKDASLTARLQSGARGVTSAEQGYRIYEIARGESTVEEFLHDFGHRAVYEADMANPRWSEDPSWILEQVRRLKENPLARDPRESAAEIRRMAEGEVRQRFGLRARLIMWLVRKLRAGLAAREGAKSALICMMLPIRRIALEIGRRCVAAGQLDSAEQAVSLSHSDLTCWLRGYWDGEGARELARDRAERRERWLAEKAPDLITEEADGSRGSFRPPEIVAGEAGVWSGIAISPGMASGVARVVRTPMDANHLMEGDILVAPSTDPGWTPLFLRASAIVMETGGFLSHGAIVAREYGIPAVANLPGILDALKDGDRIRVDGSAGRVSRLG